MKSSEIINIKSIGEHHQIVGLGKPKHQLFSIIAFDEMPALKIEDKVKFTLGFFVITLKKQCECKSQYGQTYYDFDEGIMGFTAPNQVMSIEKKFKNPNNGWMLLIRPDYLLGYQLAKKIKEYSFFNYEVNEALILSEDEEKSIEEILKNIQKECYRPIDSLSQDVLVAHIDLLLIFCNRFYTRQFITRKIPNSNLLSTFEIELDNFFKSEKLRLNGLPSISYFAQKMNLSSKYLSDLIKNLTGFGIQHHIQEKLLEKAKEKLSTTELSVGEIAYELGFEYPQSFSKMFKNKSGTSPLEFRASFN